MQEEIIELQDLGELSQTLRRPEEAGPSGVITLPLDDGSTHREAMEFFREGVDEHYGNYLDEIVSDNERVVIERLVIRADDAPHIEYQVVDDR